MSKGDKLKASTVRKIANESSTGSVTQSRVRMTLTIEVESFDFDNQSCTIHVKGRNVCENVHVRLGAYHTLDLELNRKFTLWKHLWDSVDLDRLDEACNPASKADLGAVIMQEGIGHVCLITSNMTIVRAKIEVSVPHKRKGITNQRDKAVLRFFEQMAQALIRHIDFKIVKCVLIASPGFLREQFRNYLFDLATRSPEYKEILENKDKFVLAHSSSGFKHSLNEVLQDPAVVARLSDTKASGDVQAMEEFHKMLMTDPDRACYGPKEVEKAASEQAVETWLISDSLFRSSDFKTRRRYVKIVDDVREANGTVRVVSSLHSTGDHLDKLTGIAATLRYPMPDLDELGSGGFDPQPDDEETDEEELAARGRNGDWNNVESEDDDDFELGL